mgnify:FL=1
MPDIFQDSSRYFHISAFYALSLPYYHMEHHTHSSYEIMYITSGSCRVFCLDGTQDTEFPLKSGQFIFIRPDVPHRLEIPDGFPCSILNLEFSLTPEKSPVALELLLKKDPGFSRFWNFMEASQGFCSGTDSRSFGYSLKDLLTFLQQNSGQIQKGRISLLSSFQPHAYRACILRPLQPEHPGNRLSEKSAPLY